MSKWKWNYLWMWKSTKIWLVWQSPWRLSLWNMTPCSIAHIWEEPADVIWHWLREQILPKWWHLFTRLYGVTSDNTIIQFNSIQFYSESIWSRYRLQCAHNINVSKLLILLCWHNFHYCSCYCCYYLFVHSFIFHFLIISGVWDVLLVFNNCDKMCSSAAMSSTHTYKCTL
jgi:hypothetical protein